jgi:DNA polymerase-3 subunit gamma/tau
MGDRILRRQRRRGVIVRASARRKRPTTRKPSPCRRARPAPAKAPYAYVITPVPELNWDGNWPAVAATLPLRGTAQQLAMQAELVVQFDGNAVCSRCACRLKPGARRAMSRNSPPPWPSASAAPVRVDTELGAVWYTASAEAQAAAKPASARPKKPSPTTLCEQHDPRTGCLGGPGSIVPPQRRGAAA